MANPAKTSRWEWFSLFFLKKKADRCIDFVSSFSALRTLGIPARSVSNFRSAHDTHFNRAIDYYTTEDGEPIEDMNDDSIW